MPISSSNATLDGVNPSPHAFSRGHVERSKSETSAPSRASAYAATAPAGPAPMTAIFRL
jgi:hypothetical protein